MSCLALWSAVHLVTYCADGVSAWSEHLRRGRRWCREPSFKACGESASAMLAGSLFQSPIVLDAKEYLYELVLAPLVLNLCLWFARVCPFADSSPISSGDTPTWPWTTLNSEANLRSLQQSDLRSFRPSSCCILVTLAVVLNSPLMKQTVYFQAYEGLSRGEGPRKGLRTALWNARE